MTGRSTCVALVPIAWLAVTLAIGCRGSATLPGPDERVRTNARVGVHLAGRSFVLTSYTHAGTGGEPESHSMQIDGDDVVLLVSVARAWTVPPVTGNAIACGSNAIDVTPTPNRFLIDGRPRDLPAGGIYILSRDHVGLLALTAALTP